jgi:hypothetical protein
MLFRPATVLFNTFPAAAVRFALALAPLVQFMPFETALRRIALHGIGVDVDVSIHIGPVPNVVVDNHGVPVPIEPVVSPAPGPERGADAEAPSETDSSPYEKNPGRGGAYTTNGS